MRGFPLLNNKGLRNEYIPDEQGQGDSEIVQNFHVMRRVRQELEKLLEVRTGGLQLHLAGI